MALSALFPFLSASLGSKIAMNATNDCAPFAAGRPVLWLAAFLSGVAIAPAQPSPSENAPGRAEIVWKKRGPDGRDLGLATELNAVVPRPAAPAKKPEKKDKPTKEGGKAPSMFLDDVTYHGELPAKVRQEVTCVHFALDATAHAEPEEGTLLNLDGAIVGFKAKRDERTGRGMAELVTMDVSAGGQPDWKGTGIYFMLGPQGSFTGAPKLCARIDHKNDTWALYYRDIVVRENLPLLATEAVPAISVRAGRAGDAAVLLDLRVAKAPPERNPAYVRSVNGKVDLAQAHREGHPHVYASGEKFPDKPTKGVKPEGR